MKSEEKAKLRLESIENLKKQTQKLSNELVLVVQKIKLGQHKNTKSGSLIRHKIAVINTIIGQKQLEAKN